jgi:hypothetical protein
MQATFALCPVRYCLLLLVDDEALKLLHGFRNFNMSTSNLPLTDSPWGVIDPSPMCYRNLAPQALASELRHLSAARTIGTTHCVTFQPCLEAINQDRYDVQEWDLPSGKWTFAAVFDGRPSALTLSRHIFHAVSRSRRGKNR